MLDGVSAEGEEDAYTDGAGVGAATARVAMAAMIMEVEKRMLMVLVG